MKCSVSSANKPPAAKDVPAKVAGCIDLPQEKAQQLYVLLYELLGSQRGRNEK